MNREERVERLTAFAKSRTDAALERVRQGVADMNARGEAITFRGVHRSSGVSLDFLYRNPEAKALVSASRLSLPSTPSERDEHPTAGTVERALAGRLRALEARHRSEVAELRSQLEIARGEVVALRRALRETGHDRR